MDPRARADQGAAAGSADAAPEGAAAGDGEGSVVVEMASGSGGWGARLRAACGGPAVAGLPAARSQESLGLGALTIG